MTLDLATRATGGYPADLRGAAGVKIVKTGLRADLSLELRDVQQLDSAPLGGLVPVQDPVTGRVQALNFEQLPTAQPGDGTVGNTKLTAAPALTVKGNATEANAQPQDVPLSTLAASGNPVGDAIVASTKFTPQGTAAVSRAVNLKLREAPASPLDYGGTNASAVASAFGASPAVTVPPLGSLNLDAPLTVPSGALLELSSGSQAFGSGTFTNIGTVVKRGGAAAGLPYHPAGNFGPAGVQVENVGGYHGVMGVSRNNGPAALPNGTNGTYPCAVFGLAMNFSPGNQGFAGFFRADAYAAGVTTTEVNTFNHFGPPPGFGQFLDPTAGGSAPGRGFGISYSLPVTLTVAAGGEYQSFSGIQICQEGGLPSSYINGLYMYPRAVTGFGLVVDATPSIGPQTGALIKNTGAVGNLHLQLQTTGAPAPNNPVIAHVDRDGNGTFKVQQNGRIETTGGLQFRPPASAAPAAAGDVTFALTSNTTLVIGAKGSDGVVRSVTLTLA